MALSNMRNFFTHYQPDEIEDFVTHFRNAAYNHLFMDFEGDEGNVIILSFAAYCGYGDDESVYVCACDKNSKEWTSVLPTFISILEDPAIKKYYVDDTGIAMCDKGSKVIVNIEWREMTSRGRYWSTNVNSIQTQHSVPTNGRGT